MTLVAGVLLKTGQGKGCTGQLVLCWSWSLVSQRDPGKQKNTSLLSVTQPITIHKKLQTTNTSEELETKTKPVLKSKKQKRNNCTVKQKTKSYINSVTLTHVSD